MYSVAEKGVLQQAPHLKAKECDITRAFIESMTSFPSPDCCHLERNIKLLQKIAVQVRKLGHTHSYD